MALDTKSVLEQQLGKADRQPSNFPWRLMLFTVIIFGMTVFIYAGMNFGYKSYVEREIKTLDQQISDLNKNLESGESQSLVTLYSQLLNINNLLKAHVLPSKILLFLQKNTDLGIYYLSMNFALADKSLRIEGSAVNYDSLVRQLEIIKKAPEVKGLLLSDSRATDQGDVRFSLQIFFNKDAFK